MVIPTANIPPRITASRHWPEMKLEKVTLVSRNTRSTSSACFSDTSEYSSRLPWRARVSLPARQYRANTRLITVLTMEVVTLPITLKAPPIREDTLLPTTFRPFFRMLVQSNCPSCSSLKVSCAQAFSSGFSSISTISLAAVDSRKAGIRSDREAAVSLIWGTRSSTTNMITRTMARMVSTMAIVRRRPGRCIPSS